MTPNEPLLVHMTVTFVCVCVCVCVCVTRERKDKYTGNTALPAAKVAVFGRQILEVGVRRCVGVRVVMLGVWQGDGQ